MRQVIPHFPWRCARAQGLFWSGCCGSKKTNIFAAGLAKGTTRPLPKNGTKKRQSKRLFRAKRGKQILHKGHKILPCGRSRKKTNKIGRNVPKFEVLAIQNRRLLYNFSCLAFLAFCFAASGLGFVLFSPAPLRFVNSPRVTVTIAPPECPCGVSSLIL